MRVSHSHFFLKIKSSEKLSLGEYGRQRTSKKFHDLVLRPSLFNFQAQAKTVPQTVLLSKLPSA